MKKNHQVPQGSIYQFSRFSTLLLMVTVMTFVFTACSKEVVMEEEMDNISLAAKKAHPQVEPLGSYTGLGAQTMWELQQARAHTARYKHLENALKDGYEDIHVVIPFMGYHYMKMSLVDGHFDHSKPEILVYNHNEKGEMELVAVEYAIPMALSPNMPDGFTGDHDHWNPNGEIGMWLLHAWVWKYNPDGVFNHTNANVILQ